MPIPFFHHNLNIKHYIIMVQLYQVHWLVDHISLELSSAVTIDLTYI